MFNITSNNWNIFSNDFCDFLFRCWLLYMLFQYSATSASCLLVNLTWHGWVSVFVISLRCWIDSIYEFQCKVDRYSIFLRGTQITFDPKASLVNEGRAWLLRVELLPWILYETSTLFLNFLGPEHVLRTLPLSIVIVAFPRQISCCWNKTFTVTRQIPTSYKGYVEEIQSLFASVRHKRPQNETFS